MTLTFLAFSVAYFTGASYPLGGEFPIFRYSEALWENFNLLFGISRMDGANTVTALTSGLFMAFTALGLLNVLIAYINDGFALLLERAALYAHFERARIVDEFEQFMSPAERDDENNFPMWLHVLKAKAYDDTSWRGGQLGRMKCEFSHRVSEMRGELHTLMIKKLLPLILELTATVDLVSEQTNAKQKRISEAVASMAKKLGEGLVMVRSFAQRMPGLVQDAGNMEFLDDMDGPGHPDDGVQFDGEADY